jgi:hypothetical protein
MTIVVNFWVIGGEFGSMNFDKRSFVREPPQVRALFSIVEEPHRAPAA